MYAYYHYPPQNYLCSMSHGLEPGWNVKHQQIHKSRNFISSILNATNTKSIDQFNLHSAKILTATVTRWLPIS